MLFVVIAYDGTSPGTFERRMNIRPDHMSVGQKMMDEGSFIFGGAIIDGAGKMAGGVLIVDFAEREQVEEWLRREPYVIHRVWERVEVHQFLVPPDFLRLIPKFSDLAVAS